MLPIVNNDGVLVRLQVLSFTDTTATLTLPGSDTPLGTVPRELIEFVQRTPRAGDSITDDKNKAGTVLAVNGGMLWYVDEDGKHQIIEPSKVKIARKGKPAK